MQDSALLQWQIEMGADELIQNEPVNRLVVESVEVASEHNSKNEPISVAKQPIAATGPSPGKSASSLVEEARRLADDATTREALKEAVCSYKGLSICKTATNPVFSDGNPQAEIMFIGEAPGANEDEQGIPFCGASGQLMDKAVACIGLTRERNWYISNTVFWRPPGNRKPTTEELNVCRPFVEKHIALIKPKLIVLVGGTATQSLMDAKTGITKLRGTYTQYSNSYLEAPIHMTALFHPSYLLRSPNKKKDFWFDLLRMKHFAQEHGIRV